MPAVATHAAFLRGINVGGHKQLPMSTLRALCSDAGLDDVSTYIQSGNVVFSSDARSDELETLIGEAIRERCGFDVSVMVRDRPQLERIVAENPWVDRDLDPARLTVSFLGSPVPAGVELVVPPGLPEEVAGSGREIYIHYPDGQGRSKLDRSGFWRQLAGIETTTRNWRTVTKTLDLMG